MSAYAIHHASLVVRDLAVARPFYEDILGLAISPMRPDKPFPGVWYQVGEQQIHLLICPEALQAEIRDVYPGMQRHVALRVRDLDGLRQKLAAAGIAFEASGSGRPVVFCKDPDGNSFELIGD